MQKLKMYQVDAFASQLFQGNPAAVIPLEHWLEEKTLQQIANENNLSETAFFVPTANGFHLRWFTPTHEAPLCGHATLATAYVIFKILKPELNSVHFETMSGNLGVARQDDLLVLDFPALPLHPCETPEAMLQGLGAQPSQSFKTVEDTNYYGIFESEAEILAIKPDLNQLATLFPFGVVVTAPGKTADFVSRYFAPGAGIPEDPVTGSIHCGLIPYWSSKLGKKKFYAKQLSARGGELFCELLDDRVSIGGKAVLFSEGTIFL